MALTEKLITSLCLLIIASASQTPTSYYLAQYEAVASNVKGGAPSQVSLPLQSMTAPVYNMSNAAWEGLFEYAKTKGQQSDPWIQMDQCWVELAVSGGAPFIECNPSKIQTQVIGETTVSETVITQPCDAISNGAFYWTIDEIQQGPQSFGERAITSVQQSTVLMLIGSYGMHGGATDTFGYLDTNGIGFYAWSIYQATLAAIPGIANNDIIYNMGDPNYLPAIELVDGMAEIMAQQPVDDWLQGFQVKASQMPPYTGSFAGIVVFFLTSVFRGAIPQQQVFIQNVGTLLTLTQDQIDFLIDVYQPAVLKVLEGTPPPTKGQQLRLARMFSGAFMKLIYAFLWQLDVIRLPRITNSLPANIIGARYISKINDLANNISGIPHANEHIQQANDVYYGDGHCRKTGLPLKGTGMSSKNLANFSKLAPHAKWHEEAANGIYDLYYLMTNVHDLMEGTFPKPGPSPRRQALNCTMAEAGLTYRGLLEEFFDEAMDGQPLGPVEKKFINMATEVASLGYGDTKFVCPCNGMCGEGTQCDRPTGACVGVCPPPSACCSATGSCTDQGMVDCVASFDPFCTSATWDSQCASEAQLPVCGLTC